MKQIVRYRFMSIPSKLSGEVKITIDDRVEYNSQFDGGKSTSITLFPIIAVSITRPMEVDERGNKVRPPWNPNDSLGLTKYNLPVFLNGLKSMMKSMRVPELYSYKGNRLELNDKEAEKARQVFMIGTVTIELSAVVIQQPDETMIEGVKIKFNNEGSTVALSINEMEALIYNLNTVPVDTLAFQLYQTYAAKSIDVGGGYKMRDASPKQLVDIVPVTNKPATEFKEFEE